MPDMVIVGYAPKPGCESELLNLTREHVPLLRRLGLATNRPVLAMRSVTGIVVEVFEWRTGGIADAHDHPEVQEMWERYERVCRYVPLKELPEFEALFAQFEPIDL